jgi:hypothetical protein
MCCLCCSTPLMGSPGTGTVSGYKEMARCMLPAVARRVPVQDALWVAVDAGGCTLLQVTASYRVSWSRVQWDPAQRATRRQQQTEGLRRDGCADECAFMAVSCRGRVLELDNGGSATRQHQHIRVKWQSLVAWHGSMSFPQIPYACRDPPDA